jgi:hypothetical protein
MSVRGLKRKSQTDWARFDRMTDSEIDTSDIPPLDDEFFKRAALILPRNYIDRLDLLQARKFARRLLATKWSKTRTSVTQDALDLALIVCYGRPFSIRFDLEAHRELPLDQKVTVSDILSKEEVKIHERIKGLRNESYAHSDACSKLVEGWDYMRSISLMKRDLNLKKSDIELLVKIVNKWIKYLDDQISLTKTGAFLIAPASEK